jgi:hypothetical protein
MVLLKQLATGRHLVLYTYKQSSSRQGRRAQYTCKRCVSLNKDSWEECGFTQATSKNFAVQEDGFNLGVKFTDKGAHYEVVGYSTPSKWLPLWDTIVRDAKPSIR